MPKPRIAIIGKGHVGESIQRGAERAGYLVRTTGHDPKEVREAGAWGEVIVLAVPASAREAAVRSLGDVSGKTLVDPTNLIDEDGGFGGDLHRSGAEQVQAWATGAKVVKAFNTVFSRTMATGTAKGERVSLFVAGDDPSAKRHVLDLGRAIGFQPVDAGPLSHARWLEAAGFLIIQLGYGPSKLGTDIGFRIAGAP